jgi:thiol-disulfide isomerase/thioredoxin
LIAIHSLFASNKKSFFFIMEKKHIFYTFLLFSLFVMTVGQSLGAVPNAQVPSVVVHPENWMLPNPIENSSAGYMSSDQMNAPGNWTGPVQSIPNRSTMPSKVSMELTNHLVMVNPTGSLSKGTGFIPINIPTGALTPRYFLFYYSAHWCPPCKIFTPEFVDFYNNRLTSKDRSELMVVFVSQDSSEKEMFKYMVETKMPWPAIAYSDRNLVPKVNSLAGDGIPCLVMVDSDFKEMANSYEKGRYLAPMKVLQQVKQVLKQNL